MIRIALLAGVALTALAGCGADGEPIPPTRNAYDFHSAGS